MDVFFRSEKERSKNPVWVLLDEIQVGTTPHWLPTCCIPHHLLHPCATRCIPHHMLPPYMLHLTPLVASPHHMLPLIPQLHLIPHMSYMLHLKPHATSHMLPLIPHIASHELHVASRTTCLPTHVAAPPQHLLYPHVCPHYMLSPRTMC